MSAVQLPTFQGGEFAFAAFRESLLSTLKSDSKSDSLYLLFYAVTDLGWMEFRTSVAEWLRRRTGRQAIAYVGTDHAITDPQALQRMLDDGIDVRIMMRYAGIFHPKVVWLSGTDQHVIWVGSNNLTREGLRNNIECATLVRSDTLSRDFHRWIGAIDQAASPLTTELLEEYQQERDEYGESRASAGTFTWSKKEEPPAPAATPSSTTRARATVVAARQTSSAVFRVAQTGDLIMEVMPRETGQGGKQVQLPKAAAVQFFGLPNRVGASRQIRLSYQGGINPRTLTMSIFANRTSRLVLSELDYRDRPCVLVFHRTNRNSFEYETVQRSIAPARYRQILNLCIRQTRQGSRRWGIA